MHVGIELKELHPEHHAAKRETWMDVVFIHGLDGSWNETWTHKDTGSFWPQWLADDFPSVKVWSVDYAARIGHLVSLGSSAQLSTDELGVALAARLRDNGIGSRPCIFVCHSLGGLVAKQLLVRSVDSSSDCDAFQRDNVAAVLFLATPHRGSDLANALRVIEKAKNIAVGPLLSMFGIDAGASVQSIGTCSRLIEELESGNVKLDRLNQRFSAYFAERSKKVPLRVGLFRETVGMRVAGLPTPIVVVSADSADAFLLAGSDKDPLPVYAVEGADHRTLVKLKQRGGHVWDALKFIIHRTQANPLAPDLKDPLQQEAALMIFSALSVSAVACDRPELAPRIVGEQHESRASRLATEWAGASEEGLLEATTRIRLACESLTSVRETLPRDLEALERCAGAMTLLMLRDLAHGSISISEPGAVKVFRRPDFSDLGNRMAIDLLAIATEACHAALKHWPARWKMGTDNRPEPASAWLMDDLCASPPSHYGPEDHALEIALRVAGEQPPDFDGQSPSQGMSERGRRVLLDFAREVLKERQQSQVGLVVCARQDTSPFNDPEARALVASRLAGLVTFALAGEPEGFDAAIVQLTKATARLRELLNTTHSVRQHLSSRHAH